MSKIIDERTARDAKEIRIWFRTLAAWHRQAAKAFRDARRNKHVERKFNVIAHYRAATFKKDSNGNWTYHRNFAKMAKRCGPKKGSGNNMHRVKEMPPLDPQSKPYAP